MSGPYFEGQVPSRCGHYHPDVLRLRDEKKNDGTYVRIVHCTHCGLLEYPLNIQHLEKNLARKLKKDGILEGIKEDEVDEVRKQLLAKMKRG